MKITSPVFEHNGEIPKRYTCDGADVNPPLEFYDVPDNAGSLVLIVDDPDARASTWVHWIICNISPDILQIEEDSVPEGAILGDTDFGEAAYGGPCPPSGTHSYHFKLYALDVEEISLPEGNDKMRVEEAMQNHILDEALLIGKYSR